MLVICSRFVLLPGLFEIAVHPGQISPMPAF
jgi:hypothetical protein